MSELTAVLPPHPGDRWTYAKQAGVDTGVLHTLELGDGTRPHKFDDLLVVTNFFANSGIDLNVIEGSVPLTDTTRLGRPGRDNEIDDFCELLRNAGQLGISVVCYDWMSGIRWARTSTNVPARGGSLVTAYDNKQMCRGPRPAEAADVTTDELMDNLEYFLDRVVPVAEEAGVNLGLHPDDPPIADVRGIPRIVNSVEAYDRILDLHPSDNHGVTFCQGNFAAMGENVPEAIRRFGDDIHFVHFRDVCPTESGFVETWHDAGPTDMAAAMRAYQDVGFDGPFRPDHVPTLAGKANEHPGYESEALLFAIGYIRGLSERVADS